MYTPSFCSPQGARRKTLIVFLFFSFFYLGHANAIVNLDNLHLGKKDAGFRGDVSFGLNGASGHSERFGVKSSASAQWSMEDLLYYMSFNYSYGENSGVEDQNKGFLHARRINEISNSVAWEAFSQIEHNKFARLNFRGLLGGGVRYEINHKSDSHQSFLGLGGFYSREDFTNSNNASDNGVEDIWRANIYLLERVSFSKNVSFFETLYFQPSLNAVEDFRILNILGLKTKITTQFSMSFSLEATHDSRPPQNIAKTDFNYSTSIEYHFF